MERTIFVVTADHGDYLGDHNMKDKSAIPYDGAMRIPLIFSGPGVPKGARSEEVCEILDVTPTLLELAGTTHPGKRYQGREVVEPSGRSFVPWLNGEADAIHPPGTTTGWELFGRRAIRKDAWKAVYIPQQDGTPKWQLYDLSRDRCELHDHAETHPHKLAELLALWRHYVAENGVIEDSISAFDAPDAFARGWSDKPEELEPAE